MNGNIEEPNDQTFKWADDVWHIRSAYFKQSHSILAQHQLDSFNDFVKRVIPYIIRMQSPIVVESSQTANVKRVYELEFNNVYMSKPLLQESNSVIRVLLPQEARERNFSYSGTLFVDLRYSVYDVSGGNKKQISSTLDTQVPLAKIPIMLHSEFCHLSEISHQSMPEMGESLGDIGGYFIIGGTSGASEKVLISQERMRENHAFCFKPGDKYSAICEVKSTIDQRFNVVRNITVKLEKEGTGKNQSAPKHISVGVPLLKKEISLFIVFRALGVITDREIMEMILYGPTPDLEIIELLAPSQAEALNPPPPPGYINENTDNNYPPILTQLDALNYLSEFYNYRAPDDDKPIDEDQVRLAKLELTRNALDRDFLAHMGNNDRNKAMYLGYMTRKMLDAYLKRIPYDDRDHASNKRVNVAGDLLGILFRSNFQKLVKDLRRHMAKNAAATRVGPDHSIRGVIQNASIESKIKYGISTGNWGNGKQAPTSASRKGISQELKRLSLMDTTAHLRRIQTPLERVGSKLIPPRRLHGTYVGACCLNETPEGAQVGVVKNLSLLTLITIKTSSTPIFIALDKLGVTSLENSQPIMYRTGTRILVNGQIVGVATELQTYDIYRNLRLLRRNGILEPFTSIAWYIDIRELVIQTDGGRYTRPSLIVENYRPVIENRIRLDPDFLPRLRAGNVTWSEMLTGMETQDDISDENSAVMEYLDTNELETCMIAFDRKQIPKLSDDGNLYKQNSSEQKPLTQWLKHTHIEIHPTTLLGVLGQMIPFSDHNQSPRNCYQCLWKETNVVMADGSFKRIADIKIGEKVITIDPETCNRAIATVVNHYVKSTDKKIVSIKTISGREVICTEDHPILTVNGWMHAGKLTLNDAVCVCPDLSCQSYDLEENMSVYVKNLNSVVKTLYVPIKEVISHENVEIADITLDCEPHSFVTDSGICVHNSSMGKQAMGVFVTNLKQRMDTMSHSLCYPERPLVANMRTQACIGLDKFPHGQMSIVAVACYGGYNQEDSLMLNRGSVERGFMSSLASRTYRDETRKSDAPTVFMKPNPTETRDMGENDYSLLDDKGLAKIGSIAKGKKNHVLIGKVTVIPEDQRVGKNKDKKYEDASMTIKSTDSGTVDRVIPNADFMNNTTGDDNQFYKVRVTQLRKPIIGDKFACYSEDTLVLTSIGMMPFYELTMDHMIATLDKHGRLTYEKPYNIQVYDAPEEMYHVITDKIDLLVTPNHKLFTRPEQSISYGLYEAQDMIGQPMAFITDVRGMKDDQGCHTVETFVNVNSVVNDRLIMNFNSNNAKVYCCEVSSGVLYVSRNGKSVWCGNSRSAQKGTNGMLVNPEDMPMTEDGLVPDIIMNPHAHPSRMTIAHMIEAVASKACALDGKYLDSTPWTSFNETELGDILEKHGYNRHGNSIMYNGITGEQMKVAIYICPTYYQRLKHLIADKMHARSKGPVQFMTRQPADGRSRHGGLRLGEMERDSLLSHSVMRFLRQKYYDDSDGYSYTVSSVHQTQVVANPQQNFYQYNGQSLAPDDVFKLNPPFAGKLLLSEIEAMGIDVRFSELNTLMDKQLERKTV